MAGFRLLEVIHFFLPILPEIETPTDKLSLDEKIIFTIGSGLIFLISQLPLFGLVSDAQLKINDPFIPIRSIFALEKGTLLELGLLPVITSAFIWQIAAGSRFLKVNLSYRIDRELYQTGQKLTAFILAIAFGTGLILSGYYDDVIHGYNPLDSSSAKPLWTYALIFGQIVGWNWLVTLLVEIFDKGYGFGSGVLCFVTLQVATNLIRDIVGLEIVALPNSNKTESFGAVTNFVKNLYPLNFSNISANFLNSFNRLSLPNLTQFYISLATILVTIGLQNFRTELPIRSTKVRGMNNVFPIRLLYTGALPIFFAFAVIANIQIAGFFLVKLLSIYSPFAASILGSYQRDSKSATLNLSNGILFYLSPPSSLVQAALSPIRVVTYSATIILLSCWFAQFWSKISGSAPKDIAKQFKDQGISIAGKRDVSVAKELSRVIPVASVSGAFVLAALAIASEIFGGFGKGVGAIVGVSSAFGVLEEFMLEWQQSGGASQFQNAFGGAQ
ncbi:SecY protein [Hyphopichia burtonii NRRL Y-1933]|uniref:SecY protein n=1 Tax=Hyphopichia burtonii NRRL Y-1933 TaxID=984485 RepID=A0A1E4RM79_9ASCO|nr:SecY protein [Hyphopichia burtonii NRRL Y-1933]ODV68359.1 SecY protein [Hyphopichia burtonii NRRL Y-1933]